MKGTLLLGLALLLGTGGAGAVVALAPGCRATADPYIDEMSALNARASAEWDAARHLFGEGPAREAARAEWRRRYEAGLREVRARHGR